MNKKFAQIVTSSPIKKAGVLAVGCLAVGFAAAPAKGQLGIDLAPIIAGLTALNSTMQSVLQVPMQLENQLQQQMNQFTQNSVYPASQITQAQQMAAQSQAQSAQMQSTIDTSTSSAQLAIDQQLESALLSRDPNQIGNVGGLYEQTYGQLPTSQQAPQQVLSAIDISDAAAQECQKKAIELDALADKEFAVSQQLLTQLTTVNPGNAAIVSAQAAAWILQAHGYTQSGMAQELRGQSALIGSTNVRAKMLTTNTANAGAAAATIKP